jgi:hypothetical protein
MTTQPPTAERPPRRPSRRAAWLGAIAVLMVAYILSAGPMLALGCRLRDMTKWDGFYAVYYLYLPLYPLADMKWCEAYVMWWMELFDAVPLVN